MTPASRSLSIAAVIMTHNRPASLLRVVEAICRQTRTADEIVVVDGGTAEPVEQIVRHVSSERTHVLRFDDNVGPAAGRSAGLAYAREAGHDLVWFVDDDSIPSPLALATLAGAMEALPSVSLLGFKGGTVRNGVIRHGKTYGPRVAVRSFEISDVDFVLLDGAILRTCVVDQVGLPRGDFFIMMEDVEYPLRLKRCGHDVALLHADLIQWQNLGSQSTSRFGSRPWRDYYQARNYLRMSLDLPMRRLLIGVVARELHFVVSYVGRPGFRIRMAYRWTGLWDAARGRMGRQVEPDAPSFSGPAATPSDHRERLDPLRS